MVVYVAVRARSRRTGVCKRGCALRRYAIGLAAEVVVAAVWDLCKGLTHDRPISSWRRGRKRRGYRYATGPKVNVAVHR